MAGLSLFTCDECNIYFDCGFKLITHKKLHQKLFANLVCHICAKTFGSAFLLNSHMFIHGTTGFKCEFCSGVFMNMKDLKQHQPVHFGFENPGKYDLFGNSPYIKHSTFTGF